MSASPAPRSDKPDTQDNRPGIQAHKRLSVRQETLFPGHRQYRGLSRLLPGRDSVISPVPTLWGLLRSSLALSGLPAAASDMAGGWGLENTEDQALGPLRAGWSGDVRLGPSLVGHSIVVWVIGARLQRAKVTFTSDIGRLRGAQVCWTALPCPGLLLFNHWFVATLLPSLFLLIKWKGLQFSLARVHKWLDQAGSSPSKDWKIRGRSSVAGSLQQITSAFKLGGALIPDTAAFLMTGWLGAVFTGPCLQKNGGWGERGVCVCVSWVVLRTFKVS